MNFSSLFGIVAALIVFFVSIFTATPSREIFLDPHGILIVVGGTCAAGFICFPFKSLLALTKVFVKKILGKFNHRHDAVIREIVQLSRKYQEDPQALRDGQRLIKNEFLSEAVLLLVDGGMGDDQVDEILHKRAHNMLKKHHKEASVFRTLAKFPPAFGLMGTTLGMIALLQSLGSQDAYKKLGPSMAIGLVATLYGIAIANLVLIPISENLMKLNEEDQITREIVLDGIRLLREKQHPLIVEEYLKSYLSPGERVEMKKVA